MKAITLWQPWATLVALGAKKLETRPWHTNYRGPLAIHAAKHFRREDKALCANEPFYSTLRSAGITQFSELPLGAVVAVAELTTTLYLLPPGKHWLDPEYAVLYYHQCATYGIPPHKDSDEFAFGNYAAGRCVWVLTNVRALPEPIPASGLQRLWKWTPPEGFKLP